MTTLSTGKARNGSRVTIAEHASISGQPMPRTLERRTVSGCRVMFDARTTAEAHVSRDDKNYVAEERPAREAAWRARKAKQAKK